MRQWGHTGLRITKTGNPENWGGDDAIIHTALRDGTLVWKKSSQERKDKPLNMRGRTREQLYGTDVNQRHRDVDKAGKQGILCLNEIRCE